MRHILKYNILYSLHLNKWKWGLFIILISIFMLPHSLVGESSLELLYNGFGGVFLENKSKIPYLYIFLQIYVLFIVGDFFNQDYSSTGVHLVIRQKNKRTWLKNKLIWLNINLFGYYFLTMIILGFMGRFTFSYHDIDIENGLCTFLSIFLLLILGSFTNSLIYLLFSLLLNSNYSIGILMLLHILSCFVPTTFLPGAHTMILRLEPFSGVNWIEIVLFNLILITLFLFLLFIIIKRKDELLL